MMAFNTSWLEAVRPGRRVGHTIEAHVSIGSTNDRARELLLDGDADGVAVVADEQTSGRGRRGRVWHSPRGRSLAVSVVVRPMLAAADAPMLSLAAALAVAEACAPVAPVRLKWPNDVVAADGRKVGGILIETIIDGDRLAGAVIGIGINVDWRRSDMPNDIRDLAVALGELAGAPVDRIVLLGRVLDALSDEIDRLERGELPLDRYRELCATLGQVVSTDGDGGATRGLAVGLGSHGELLIQADDGIHELAGGDLAVIGRA